MLPNIIQMKNWWNLPPYEDPSIAACTIILVLKYIARRAVSSVRWYWNFLLAIIA